MERKNALAKTVIEHETEILLPASAGRVDKVLVDRAITHIREVLAKTVTRGLDEVGRYLLKEFFDDDPEVFFASGPNRHASLRKLIEQSESIDLPVNRTFLVNALRVAVVGKALPESATFNRLPPSHRVELLRVREPAALARLAGRAVDGKLSVLKLRALVQKAVVRQKESPGRGRTAKPAVLKVVDGCLRLLRDEETGKLLLTRSDVLKMTDEQQELAKATFKALDKRVSELRRILG
jgi:hypothetical protein